MFKSGQIVKFSVPHTDAERDERFEVVEDRVERVLVKSADAWWKKGLCPTFAYDASDMEVVK